MLDIWEGFAKEFIAQFNASKSKLVFSKHNNFKCSSVSFMNGSINVVSQDLHLGNLISNISHEDLVCRIVNDFQTGVNMIKRHSKGVPAHDMYYLFKTYCMPLHGSQLLGLGARTMEKFYVTWRKAIDM